jgi:DNA-binding CsgD family transcriptional regulator
MMDHPLTQREREVLPYLVAGKANKVVAIEMGISQRTVEAHRARILRKMGARTAMELACRVCPYTGAQASPEPARHCAERSPPTRPRGRTWEPVSSPAR